MKLGLTAATEDYKTTLEDYPIKTRIKISTFCKMIAILLCPSSLKKKITFLFVLTSFSPYNEL